MDANGVLTKEEAGVVRDGLRILQDAIGCWAISRGFQDINSTDNNVNHDQKLLLIVSEVVEAQEELRHGHLPYEKYYEENGKPCGYRSELADIMIRLLQLADSCGYELVMDVLEKHNFNGTRPYKHGKKF